MNEVLVVIELKSPKSAEFEAFVKEEGFEAVENEAWAYHGLSSTPVFNTKAYIFETFAKAFELIGVEKCRLICQIGLNEPEIYLYDRADFFTEI